MDLSNSMPPPLEDELVQCLPCGGQSLSGFDESLSLPYVKKDHDLVDVLSTTVIKDASVHPKKPVNELMSTILHTSKLTCMVMSEMKRYGLAIKSFSNALGMNPASFSLALREPRHWFDANLVQKKCYFVLYLWLNLPQKYRESTLRPMSHESDIKPEDENPVETMPTVKALINVFINELNTNNISLQAFANKFLKEDSIVVRNMIMNPLPWELLSWKMKVKYARIWFWLKQRATSRLAMLGMKNHNHPDTAWIAQETLKQLKHYNMTSLINDINKGLPPATMNSLLYNPVDWNYANEHEKYIYLSLLQWLGQDVGNAKDNLEIDTSDLSFSSMAFIRENGITVTEFADKIVKIPRAHVSLYFNSPVHWSKANPALRAGLINVSFWMDLEPSKRLERIKPEQIVPCVQNTFEKGQCDLLQEAKAIVATVVHSDEALDTELIARLMKIELRKAGISLKSFSKVVQINRNYFASLINTPLRWEATTKLQRFVYLSMKTWIDFRMKSGNKVSKLPLLPVKIEAPSRKALKPINGQNVKGRRQKRVKFTPEQRDYLLEYFKTNQRPNHEEKVAISKHLGLGLRTVMIFFCNRRTRLNGGQKL